MNVMPVRERLYLSQTDVTPSPEEGYLNAVVAYNQATHDEVVTLTDPTAAGEAAAKAALRAEQLGKPADIVDEWLCRSDRSLREAAADPHWVERAERETVATNIIAVRVLGARALKSGDASIRTIRAKADAGQRVLKDQHKTGRSWDRYATMLDAHGAATEAVLGSSLRSAATATRGLWRAIRTKREEESSLGEHLKFVAKHTAMNVAAGVLAVSKIFKPVPELEKHRQKAALKFVS